MTHSVPELDEPNTPHTGLQGPSRSRSAGPQGNGLGPEEGSGPNPGARACQAAPSPGAPAQHPRPGPAEGLGAGTREDTAFLALHSRATQTTQGGRGPTSGGTASVRLADGGGLSVVGHNRPVRPHGPRGSPTEGEPGGQEFPPGGLRVAGSHLCRRSALLRGAWASAAHTGQAGHPVQVAAGEETASARIPRAPGHPEARLAWVGRDRWPRTVHLPRPPGNVGPGAWLSPPGHVQRQQVRPSRTCSRCCGLPRGPQGPPSSGGAGESQRAPVRAHSPGRQPLRCAPRPAG